ncbi:hypothetical protein FXO38_10407 [Capsicum annuum]|nr:hypothetical protein FXO37_15912 [Capsicum annuum]KAF3663855.1 hypothetical protein FXO38_10407 [Capsicum annuum]
MIKNSDLAGHCDAPQLLWLTGKCRMVTGHAMGRATIAVPYSFAILAIGAPRHCRVGLLEIEKCKMELLHNMGDLAILARRASGQNDKHKGSAIVAHCEGSPFPVRPISRFEYFSSFGLWKRESSIVLLKRNKWKYADLDESTVLCMVMEHVVLNGLECKMASNSSKPSDAASEPISPMDARRPHDDSDPNDSH